MEQLIVNAGGGLVVSAWIGRETDVVPLGVAVELHPGIPVEMRQMVLETVLRRWQREVGSVTRGAPALVAERETWLRGWTLKAFQQGTVISMRVAFRVPENESKEKIA
jgi:hypothetical protein